MNAPEITNISPDPGGLHPDKSARLWQKVFEASTDAQAICRLDGSIEQVNPRAMRFLKLPPGKPPGGLSIFNSVKPPADQQLRDLLTSNLTQPETLWSVTVEVLGSVCGLTDLEVIPLDDARVLVLFRDASRRFRLESHMRRLVTAIDSTPEVFFITDADHRIVFVNPAFQANTFYGFEEVIGRTDAFLRASGQQDKVREYLAAATCGKDWVGELTNARKDGSRYQVEANVSPIFDGADQFMGYVVCERDITPRLQLQEQLRMESEFAHSILASLDAAIYTLDRQFCLTHVNDGWRRLPSEHGGIRLGAAPEIGRSLLDYVPDPARSAELCRLFQKVLDSGQPEENQFLSPDDRHWFLKVSPRVHRGEVCGLICNFSDQTQFHKLQSQILQSQKMEIVGTLAASVAHDFNNLLQAIRGNVSLVLLQAQHDSSLHHCAEQINVASTRAAEITRQLLSFSRNSEEETTVLDLNEIIREAGQLARRTLRGNVTLEIVSHPEAIPVKVDPTRANQALLNLCVNAQDAMPQGGRLTITSNVLKPSPAQVAKHGANPEAEYACCNVSDTGSGIPAELLDRVFEPFFTTKEKGKGTGLGLPIVQRVLKEAGGFIEVDTVSGHGTTFHLYFPLIREQVTPVEEPVEQQLAQGSGRVLVVDDLDLLRDFTKTFLEAVGLVVLVASSASEALKVLEQSAEPVDLLFTDYNMPDMNGIELIDRVAAQWPHIRLVLASGYLDEAALKRLEGKSVSILRKPYNMQDGAELIIKLLSEKQPARSAET